MYEYIEKIYSLLGTFMFEKNIFNKIINNLDLNKLKPAI